MKKLIVGESASGYMGALFENDRVVEIFHEEYLGITGNIFLGKVKRVVETLAGAFVDIGLSKSGYLKLKDVTKKYRELVLKDSDLTPGTKILVQVKKDGTSKKGPHLTTKISLAGRFLVYFPLSYARGISRKITGDERERLKRFLKQLKLKDEGLVIRTAAAGIDDEFLEEELEYLKETWKEIFSKFKRSRKPKKLFGETEVYQILLRDRLERDLDEVITNDYQLYEELKSIVKVYGKISVKLKDEDIFESYGVTDELKKLSKRNVPLESGGEIVIDNAEAFTVIDVNTASNVKGTSHKELVFETNVEAAKEIARQIRLRNIGGVIVVDFITMNSEEEKEKVIEVLKNETSKDRAKVVIYGFTKLGLLEMVRKRSYRSFSDIFLRRCPVCGGSGFVASPKIILSNIERELAKTKDVKGATVYIHRSLSGYLNKAYVKSLKRKAGYDVEFSFGYDDPNSYEIVFKK